MNRLIDIIFVGGLLLSSALSHADGLDRWHARYSAPGEVYFSSIASGPESFVAVSENGRIVTSTDAVQWTLTDFRTTARLDSVAFGNGAFVVTGYPDTVIRSTDGTNWQSAGWQDPPTLSGHVSFANGQFFLLAYDGAPKLYISSTGTNWSRDTRGLIYDSSASLFSLAYANSNYVAVGRWSGPDDLNPSPTPLVLISQDTVTWKNIPVFDLVPWWNRVAFESVTFGKGLFVAVGRGLNDIAFIAYSADGRNWKLVNDIFDGLQSVAYGDGVFVAAGAAQIVTSTDGVHWRKRDPGHDRAIPSITYGQNTFVTVVSGGQIWQSDPIASLMLGRSSPLELSIFGPVGKSCQVEATEDLGATNGWATVANFVLTNSPAAWTDSGSTNRSQRFYRAALQP